MLGSPGSAETVKRWRKYRLFEVSAPRSSLTVSFYNGGAREKSILWGAYEALAKHVHTVFKIRIPYGSVLLHVEPSVSDGQHD